ncbi:MAG TPA: methyltransferase domain-containing protein [Gemmataceae bacterium]|nr:methyltransferase domain-containing protein [Gemmataceae bacterium]
MSLNLADQANQRMVDRMIAEGALWSRGLIDAFRQTPRHRFLHHVYALQKRGEGWREIDTREPAAQEIDLLYSDRALITRLAAGDDGRQVAVSSSSQPSLMAEMLEDLRLEAGQCVLEIGAGTGYNAALMAHVVGANLVHSVDVDRVVLAEAAEHFLGFAGRGVFLHHGDGRQGWLEAAPFDRLMVTAATPDFEPAWLEQVTDGGVLVAPVVFAPGMAFVARGEVRHGVFCGGLTRGAYFMPLRTEEEAPHETADVPAARVSLKTRPAPWAGWFERHRPRLGWGSFLQAIVFYGWLRGLDLLHSGGNSAYASYGVCLGDDQCWFSSEDWQVSGAAGQELGEALWRAWLAAGGPWPTEFCLTAAAGALEASGSESFVRQGPRCRQVWTLKELRPRPGWR